MATRGKVVKAKLPTEDFDLDFVQKTFNGILNGEEADISIIYTKFIGMYENMKSFTDSVFILADSPLVATNDQYVADFASFIAILRAILQDCEKAYACSLKSNGSLEKTTVEDEKTVREAYTKLKESQALSFVLLICDNLSPYKESIADITKLNMKIFSKLVDPVFQPFKFENHTICNINFALLMLENDDSPNTKQFILTLLHKLYVASRSLWSAYSTPDLDIKKFSVIVTDALKQMQNHPELSRCADAFKILNNSTQMLEDNFGTYYRDMLATNDTSTIITDYINDVSQKAIGASSKATVMGQFRKIMAFCSKRKSNASSANPKTAEIFDKLNKSFEECAQKHKKIIDAQKNTPKLKEDEIEAVEYCTKTEEDL